MRLRTSDAHRPGFSRRRCGGGFRYLDASGRALDEQELPRVRELVIPPAWRDVWICPWPNGHLQAVGTDAAGRRQYLYHEEFRRQREAAKHAHVLEASASFPLLRERVAHSLDERGLTRARVLACSIRLLDLGFLRIGSEGYTRANETYGLSTLLREHVVCHGNEIRIAFPAKHAKRQALSLVDPQAVQVVRALLRRRQDDPRLFACWEGRAWHTLQSGQLNEALRLLAGLDLTAKDFRTWHATVLAAVGLAISTRAREKSATARKRAVARVVSEVSGYLGNTPAVARASYINPLVIERYDAGRTVAADLDRLGEHRVYGQPATQGAVEEAVRRLLRD